MLIPEILKPQYNRIASEIYKDVELKVDMVKLSMACIAVAVNGKEDIFDGKSAHGDVYIHDVISHSLDILDTVNDVYPYTQYFDTSDKRVETVHRLDDLTGEANRKISENIKNISLLKDAPSLKELFQFNALGENPKENLSLCHSSLQNLADMFLKNYVQQRKNIDRLIVLELGHEAVTDNPVANMDRSEGHILPIAIDFRSECIVQQNKAQKLIACLRDYKPC